MNVVAVHSFQPIPLFVFMALDQFYNTQEKEIVSGGFCLFVRLFFFCLSTGKMKTGLVLESSLLLLVVWFPPCVSFQTILKEVKRKLSWFFSAEVDGVINCSESSLDFKVISDYAPLHQKTAFSAKDDFSQCFVFP